MPGMRVCHLLTLGEGKMWSTWDMAGPPAQIFIRVQQQQVPFLERPSKCKLPVHGVNAKMPPARCGCLPD